MRTSTTQETIKSIPTPAQLEKNYPQLAPLMPEPGDGWFRDNPIGHLLGKLEWQQEALLALFRKTLDDPDPDSSWGMFHAARNQLELLRAIRTFAEEFPSGFEGSEGETPPPVTDEPERPLRSMWA